MTEEYPFDDVVRAAVAVIRGDGGFITPEEARSRGLEVLPLRVLAILRRDECWPDVQGEDYAPHFRQWVLGMGWRQDDLWKLKRALQGGWGNISANLVHLVTRAIAVCARETGRAVVGAYPWRAEKGHRSDMTLRLLEVGWEDHEANYGGGGFMERSVSCVLEDTRGSIYHWNRKVKTPENPEEAPEPAGKEGQWWRLRATIKALTADERGRAVTQIERVALDRKVSVSAI